jgi:hypothetical protein
LAISKSSYDQQRESKVKTKYKPGPRTPTRILEAKIAEIFNVDVNDVDIFQRPDGLALTVEGALSWPGGMLNTLLRLKELCKAEDFDMPSHYHSSSGCDTCDYGATDTWEFFAKGGKL